MKLKYVVAPFMAVMLLFTSTFGASASGTAYISGSASGTVKYYYTDRTISTPGTPGPDVAFYQDSGPVGLQLGTHNCSGTPTSTLKDQTHGAWMPVATSFTAGTVFCMRSYSTSGTGSFAGTLDWD